MNATRTTASATAEANRIVDFLASLPTGITSADSPVVREIMLQTSGVLLAQGEIFDIVAKSLGGGVHQLCLKPRAGQPACGCEHPSEPAGGQYLCENHREIRRLAQQIEDLKALPFTREMESLRLKAAAFDAVERERDALALRVHEMERQAIEALSVLAVTQPPAADAVHILAVRAQELYDQACHQLNLTARVAALEAEQDALERELLAKDKQLYVEREENARLNARLDSLERSSIDHAIMLTDHVVRKAEEDLADLQRRTVASKPAPGAWRDTKEEAASDARLMGAASELADALEELLGGLSCDCGDRHAGHLAHCHLFDAETALKKAGRLP